MVEAADSALTLGIAVLPVLSSNSLLGTLGDDRPVRSDAAMFRGPAINRPLYLDAIIAVIDGSS